MYYPESKPGEQTQSLAVPRRSRFRDAHSAPSAPCTPRRHRLVHVDWREDPGEMEVIGFLGFCSRREWGPFHEWDATVREKGPGLPKRKWERL